MKKYRFEEEASKGVYEDSFRNFPSEVVQNRSGFQRNFPTDGNHMLSSVSGHEQLKNLQLMALMKLELSCQTIMDTWRFKILGNVADAFARLKTVEINESNRKRISKKDIEIVWNLGQVFSQKIAGVVEIKMKKNLALGFCAIKISEQAVQNNPSRNYAYNGSTVQDKSNSVTSPYRINQKAQNSDRVDSQWDLGRSQGGAQWNQNLSRQNRFLKKKKDKMKVNKEKIMDKFESLLSQHESYLNMNK